MLVARRGVSPAWSHDNVSLVHCAGHMLIHLTPRVKLHLDTTEHGDCFQTNIYYLLEALLDNNSLHKLITLEQEGEFYSNSNSSRESI